MLSISLITASLLLGAADTHEPHRRLVIGGDCRECIFEDANLANAQFIGGDFSKSDFSGTQLLGARIQNATFNKANFHDALLSEAHISNTQFNKASMKGVDLNRARLHNVQFYHSELSQSQLDGAVFFQAKLDDADLRFIQAEDVIFRNSSLVNADIRLGKFSQIYFFKSDLSQADFRNSDFENAIFEHVDLTDSDFRDTDLSSARFVGSRLDHADFRATSGLSHDSFLGSCGREIRGLPTHITLNKCVETNRAVRSAPKDRRPAPVISFKAPQADLAGAPPQPSGTIDLQIAEQALVQALSQVQAGLKHGDILIAQEKLTETLAKLAETQIELSAEFHDDGDIGVWQFEINPSEIGEPLRVILQSHTSNLTPQSFNPTIEHYQGSALDVLLRELDEEYSRVEIEKMALSKELDLLKSKLKSAEKTNQHQRIKSFIKELESRQAMIEVRHQAIAKRKTQISRLIERNKRSDGEHPPQPDP